MYNIYHIYAWSGKVGEEWLLRHILMKPLLKDNNGSRLQYGVLEQQKPMGPQMGTYPLLFWVIICVCLVFQCTIQKEIRAVFHKKSRHLT